MREAVNGPEAVDQEVLAARIRNLQSSFEDSEFVVDSQPPTISWRYITNGLKALPFTINLEIDTEKPL